MDDLQALREELEAAEAKVREIERHIEVAEEWQRSKRSPYIVVLKNGRDEEIKYAQSQEHATKLLNDWLDYVRDYRHVSFQIETIDSDPNRYRYWFSSGRPHTAPRTYNGTIEVLANPEYMADESEAT